MQFLRYLDAQGIQVSVGHAVSWGTSCDALVVSSAIQADHPLIIQAKNRGIPVFHRAEFLARLTQGRMLIAITGTHGKTTTTALVVHLLKHAGFNPGYMIGGHLVGEQGQVQASWGQDDYFVIEADESDRSFLHYTPNIVLAHNLDDDHLAADESLSDLSKLFTDWINALPAGTKILLGVDDDAVKVMATALVHACHSYAIDAPADYVAQMTDSSPEGACFSWVLPGGERAAVQTQLFGRHNVMNGLAALSLVHILGIPIASYADHIKLFRGVHRRFQWCGHWPIQKDLIPCIDDYGHHPTALKATASTMRSTLAQPSFCLVFPTPPFHTYGQTF